MSKMVAIELLNFMSIESARLDFDDTGILNITGYNDSGKSAITRSLEVLFYDAYSGDQINFIKDDAEFFGVGVEFDDGVAINKYKYSNGKSVWEMLKGEEVIFTNQLADGVAAMSTIPEPIANYLGVVKDEFTDEQLNVRRNTDKLFLINTTGGDNYKIINSILRCDILAESVKRMNEDRNKLQSEVSNKATSSKTLKGELDALVVLDDSLITSLQTKSENLRLNKQRGEYLIGINNQKQILDDFVVYEELPIIDTSRSMLISQLQELKKATETPIYDELTILDVSRVQELEAIKQLRENLHTPIPPELTFVGTERMKDIRAVGEAFNNLYTVTTNLSNVEKEYEAVHNQLHTLSKEYGFKICNNCGTVVE